MRKILLFSILITILSCGRDYGDAEEEYTKILNDRFRKNLPHNVRNNLMRIIESEGNYSVMRNFPRFEKELENKKICGLEFTYDRINDNERIFIPDHEMNKVFLDYDKQLSYNLDSLDYLIFQTTDLKEAGKYVDEFGNHSQSAYIPHDFIYAYDLHEDQIYFVYENVGDFPDETITTSDTRYESGMNGGWYNTDIGEYLIAYVYNDTLKDHRYYASQGLVEFIEKNNIIHN